jgi:hypothetical protein
LDHKGIPKRMGDLMKLKISISAILLFVLVSCNQKGKAKTAFVAQKVSSDQTGVDSFNEFRNSLYQNDTIKLKSFFKFPVMNEGNEIWYLIEDEHQLSFAKGEIKPFTETDLNNYYFKLFDQYFINSILKIETKKLFRNGYNETSLLTDGEVSYNMNASYIKDSRQIVLNFYTEEKVQTGGNGEYEKAEFSKIYYFDVLSNNKIRFNKVRLAG